MRSDIVRFGLCLSVICACSRSRTNALPASTTVVAADAMAGPTGSALVAAFSPEAGAEPPPVTPKVAISAPVDPSPYNWRLTTDGLPAVSADGRHAVLVVDQPDGGRGYPKSELVFLSVDADTVEKKIPLFVPDEFSTPSAVPSAAEARTITSKIEKRLERARAELAKTTGWVSLAYTRESGPVAGVDVSLGSGRLRARDRSSSVLLLDHGARTWTAGLYKIADFAPCTFEAALALTAVDTTRRVLVVVVSQVPSGDQCEQPSVAHALRMKP